MIAKLILFMVKLYFNLQTIPPLRRSACATRLLDAWQQKRWQLFAEPAKPWEFTP